MKFSTYCEPHRWLLVEQGDIHKVFASFTGGYLDSNSWRLNSGIESVEVDEDGNFLFHGFSGSAYRCRKDAYGTTGYGSMVLADLIEKVGLKPLKDFKQYIEDSQS
jgi:hypothetical protein